MENILVKLLILLTGGWFMVLMITLQAYKQYHFNSNYQSTPLY